MPTGVTSPRILVPATFLMETLGEVSQGSGYPHADSQDGDQGQALGGCG